MRSLPFFLFVLLLMYLYICTSIFLKDMIKYSSILHQMNFMMKFLIILMLNISLPLKQHGKFLSIIYQERNHLSKYYLFIFLTSIYHKYIKQIIASEQQELLFTISLNLRHQLLKTSSIPITMNSFVCTQ
ncbi:hypothetical protein L873DRAFT_245441 [Choiromyces venosus 120613-1]|uniref:Transmembrane protein n=1 Tax=Choiromyces venosus 120613-1 TaxID=1336337 RepID=A0A3N4J1J5_9PEZI|nr:hypothetical protein L873DRAFT_245441 [Choiromyces venosus 120613-1]